MFEKFVSAENKEIFQKINNLLSDVEIKEIQRFSTPELPISFIVGAPRSASTLLSQILAKTGKFGYISNFSAKFWMAPYIGLLQEYAMDLRNTDSISFDSVYGSTTNLSGPHEFSYFWDRWFKKGETHEMDSDLLNELDFSILLKELHAMESVYKLPLFFKNLRLSFYINHLKKIYSKSKFIICLRDPLYQAQSLLQGRLKKNSNLKKWYSIKPKEYADLKRLDPYEQVVGQIYYILKSIFIQLEKISAEHYVVIHYEKFVKQTHEFLENILKINNISINETDLSNLPTIFQTKNKVELSNSKIEKIKNSINYYFKNSSIKNLNAYLSYYDF